ncbi:hypothetical protein LJB98_05365 [Bacteroidales bacterium OttesenSCG-928-M11]|nr:hypothetical protein [Bacteroidales bacterium OttesenSCG-928-M11]
MKKLNIIGIRRGNLYSPNHIGNDAAIFNLTVELLKAKGCEVTEYTETEFQNISTIQADAIFNMARDFRTISKLQEVEDQGIKVINSGYGIQNCMRANMTHLMLENNIPHPQSLIVSTDEPLPDDVAFLGKSCWVKRGDSHAIHREDVTYAKNGELAESIIQEYALRGIPTAVINEHLLGDLIKFYGITGTDFFHWFYSDDLNYSKFGLEAINGKPKRMPFDESYLKNISKKASQIMKTPIYGGDCIVDDKGNIRIIDFNDWPSFAPCRNEAAPNIAQCIYDYARKD